MGIGLRFNTFVRPNSARAIMMRAAAAFSDNPSEFSAVGVVRTPDVAVGQGIGHSKLSEVVLTQPVGPGSSLSIAGLTDGHPGFVLGVMHDLVQDLSFLRFAVGTVEPGPVLYGVRRQGPYRAVGTVTHRARRDQALGRAVLGDRCGTAGPSSRVGQRESVQWQPSLGRRLWCGRGSRRSGPASHPSKALVGAR